MSFKTAVTIGFIGTSMVLSSFVYAAEVSIRVTATIIEPVSVTTSFNPANNTLKLEAKGISSYSLDINQSQDSIRIEINNMKLDPASQQQQVPLDGELALTVNHSPFAQSSQKPTVTLNYN